MNKGYLFHFYFCLFAILFLIIEQEFSQFLGCKATMKTVELYSLFHNINVSATFRGFGSVKLLGKENIEVYF